MEEVIDFGLGPARGGVKGEGKTEITPSNVDLSQLAAGGVNVVLCIEISKLSGVWVAIAGRTAGRLQGDCPHSQAPFTNFSFTELSSQP